MTSLRTVLDPVESGAISLVTAVAQSVMPTYIAVYLQLSSPKHFIAPMLPSKLLLFDRLGIETPAAAEILNRARSMGSSREVNLSALAPSHW